MKYYWEYDYYDRYEDDDSDYGLICQDPKNTQAVTDVSMLRHYINCWGWTKALKRHVNPLTYDQVVEIVDLCKGSTSIKSLKKDYDNIIKEANDIRIAQAEREMNNYILIEQLHSVRNNFCGLDTRNIKLMLNKIGKTDPVALAIRYLLEAEDYNIKAKESYGEYRDKNYEKKSEFVEKALDVCLENNFKCGWQDSDLPNISHVVYFDIPGVEQISFHQDLSSEYLERCPEYDSEWDSLVNSTLLKIEKAIKEKYSDYIELKKEKLKDTRKNAEKQKQYRENAKRREREERERQWREEEMRRENELRKTIDSNNIQENILNKLPSFKRKLNRRDSYEHTYLPVRYSENGLLYSSKDNKRFNFYVNEKDEIVLYKREYEKEKFEDKKFCDELYEVKYVYYFEDNKHINKFKDEIEKEIEKRKEEERLQKKLDENAKKYTAKLKYLKLNFDNISEILNRPENLEKYIPIRNHVDGWFSIGNEPKTKSNSYHIFIKDDMPVLCDCSECSILNADKFIKVKNLDIKRSGIRNIPSLKDKINKFIWDLYKGSIVSSIEKRKEISLKLQECQNDEEKVKTINNVYETIEFNNSKLYQEEHKDFILSELSKEENKVKFIEVINVKSGYIRICSNEKDKSYIAILDFNGNVIFHNEADGRKYYKKAKKIVPVSNLIFN